MIDWIFFPKSARPPRAAREVIDIFSRHADEIASESQSLKSDEVLAVLSDSLEHAGFKVEKGKRRDEKISVPVLFGLQGRPEKTFDVDAFNVERRFVLEVEAGRGVVNNQFLKDIFQACMMPDADYLAIAVRKRYKRNKNFETVYRFLETLYVSQRLVLPLKGILVIGY